MTTALPQTSGRRARRSDAIVDVGIPAHGRPQFLVDTIESILGQTLTDFRLRIFEDGPGGGAVEEAVQPYLEDPRVSFSASGEQLGAARNSDRVIQAGDAPYVHLIHDDDVVEAGFLERHVDFLEEHPDCGVAFSGYAVIDPEGRQIADYCLPLPAGELAIEDFVPLMLHHNVLSTHCGVVRRSAYEAVGNSFDASFPWAYDYEMWFRLATQVKFGYLPVSDAFWRRHGEQITYRVSRGEEYLRLLDHADRLLQAKRPDLRLDDRLQRRKRSSALLSASIDALGRDEPKAAAGHLREAVRGTRLALLDPRTFCALAGLAFGRPGRRFALACRRFLHDRGHRLVYRPYPKPPPHMPPTP